MKGKIEKDFFISKPYVSFNENPAVLNYLQQIRTFCDNAHRAYAVETQKFGFVIKITYDAIELADNKFHRSLLKQFGGYLKHNPEWINWNGRVIGTYTLNSKSIVDNIGQRSYVWVTIIFSAFILFAASRIILNEGYIFGWETV